MTVQELRIRGNLQELNVPTDVNAVKDALGISCDQCISMFVRKADGVFMEVFGCANQNPLYTDEVHEHETSK
jgi:hypothetical protein